MRLNWHRREVAKAWEWLLAGQRRALDRIGPGEGERDGVGESGAVEEK
jgi:hypothetical protein